MARTLPGGMAAAIAAGGQKPTYTVTIQDIITRFSTLSSGNTVGRVHGILTSANTILRGNIDASGNVLMQRITTPTSASQWNAAYTTLVATDAVYKAGCWLVQTGANIRMFYQKSSTNNMVYVQSTNDGSTWGAVTSYGPAVPNPDIVGICADSTTNVWATAASLIHRSSAGGAWNSEGPSTPTWGKVRGLSCVKVGGTTKIACGLQYNWPMNGIGCSLTSWNGAAYTAFNQAKPMDNSTIGISLSNPHIWYDSSAGTYYLTVLHQDDGSLSGTVQTRLQIYSSTDAVSWVPWQDLGNPFQQAVALIVLSGLVFVFDGATVVTTPVGPSPTDVSNDVLSMVIHESTNAPAQLSLILSNNTGQYNAHPSVKVDSRITVSFGYDTTVLTTHQFILDTYTYNAGPALQDLTIVARNYPKLLDYPQHRFLVYQNQTVAQLCTTICQQAGVTLATLPGTSQFSQVVPCFVISPGETWFQAIDRVGKIYGFDLFADQTPQIRIQERLVGDASTWTYGLEAFVLSYGASADQANVIRVVGQTSVSPTTPVFADVMDGANLLAEGKERFRNIVDRHLDTSAKCLIRANLALREEQMNAQHGEVTVTINPQHELLDVIQLTDSNLGITNKPLRIHQIQWLCEPERAIWEQKLTLSGV